MLSFTFGNKNSFADYGIIVERRPTIPSPKRRVELIEVPGRSSALRYDEGTYDDITLMLECVVKDTKEGLAVKLDAIRGWLLGAGESDLVLSYQPDRCYRAQLVNSVDFTIQHRRISTFPLLFNCRPFKYAANNNSITLSNPTTITNPGTLYARPLFDLSSSATVTANGYNFSLDRAGKVDSELQEFYGTSGLKMSGVFPLLKTGANTISWTGGATVKLTTNWRWL